MQVSTVLGATVLVLIIMNEAISACSFLKVEGCYIRGFTRYFADVFFEFLLGFRSLISCLKQVVQLKPGAKNIATLAGTMKVFSPSSPPLKHEPSFCFCFFFICLLCFTS